MSYLTLKESLYPKSRWFKPVKVTFLQIPPRLSMVERRFLECLQQKQPPTEEEKAYRRRWSSDDNYINAPMDGLCDSFDDDTTKDWKQTGIFWERVTQGPHPHCWINSRVGAMVRWRNAPGSYCCAGLPYFSQQAYERFRKEMEIVKPVVHCPHFKLTISLERTLRGPYGTCWGITTEQVFWRIDFESESITFKATKAELSRQIKQLAARMGERIE